MTNRRGLSLIEVLIAIAILGVVFVVLAALQVSNLRVTADARVESDLLAAAVTTFERSRSVVLQDFEHYRSTCVAAAPAACTDAGVLAVAGGNVVQLSAAAFGTPPVVYPGILRLEIEAVDLRGDRSLTLVQYVSCLDGDQIPQLAKPSVCRGTGS